jgi:AcrR family transcriptional regulator
MGLSGTENAHPDGRVERGERTRRQILDLAVHLASVEGLEGLSIGKLAGKLKMSKSGLFASFGSKEELQFATIEHARQIFVDAVVRKPMMAPRGLPRLWALCDSWLDYAARSVFRGGCFFSAVSAEFDSRPGPIRDRIAVLMKEWLTTLSVAVQKAQQAGHLRADLQSEQLAFEIHSLSMGANWAHQLHGDQGAFDRARTAIRQRLSALTPTNMIFGAGGVQPRSVHPKERKATRRAAS